MNERVLPTNEWTHGAEQEQNRHKIDSLSFGAQNKLVHVRTAADLRG